MQTGTSSNSIGSSTVDCCTPTQAAASILDGTSSTGDLLAEGLARDQALREQRRRTLGRWLAGARGLEQLGRWSCVAAGLIGPWAVAPQPLYLGWLELPVFDTLAILRIGGLGMVLAGMAARRFLLGFSRRRAIETTPPTVLNAPESLPDEKLRELQIELEAIRKSADDAEKICVGCSLFGAALIAARQLGVFLEDSSSGWLVLLFLVPLVLLVDLVAAGARVVIWASYRTWLRRSAAAADSSAEANRRHTRQ